MNTNHIKERAPVIAFAVCIVGGWIVSYLRDDWFLSSIGIVVGFIAGDFAQAICSPTEIPPLKRTHKPR